MSDVERRIEQWRAGLADSEVIGRADIQEMESHLREEITHLETSGLSSDEAFLLARHRLGDPAALEGEFAKVRPHRGLVGRLCWAMMGVLLYLAATEFGYAAFYLFLKFGYMVGLRETAVGLLGGLVEIAGFAGPILLALWLYIRRLPRHPSGQVRNSMAAPMVAAALALGTWVFLVAGRLLTIVFVRTVGTAHFGAVLRTSGYVREVWHLMVPALLAAFLIVLYRRSRREVQAM